jgi:hypothetical protein
LEVFGPADDPPGNRKIASDESNTCLDWDPVHMASVAYANITMAISEDGGGDTSQASGKASDRASSSLSVTGGTKPKLIESIVTKS